MSSSDPFEILGLERKGATEADIKRAYAKKLKTTRPDDDREGFMALREALEQAKNELRWAEYDDDAYADEDENLTEEKGYEDPFDVEEDNPASSEALDDEDADLPAKPDPENLEILKSFPQGAEWDEPEDEGDPDWPEPEESQTIDPAVANARQQETEAVHAAMADINDLMLDEARRTHWAEWTEILDRENLMSIEAFQLTSMLMRGEICRRTGFDPENLQAELVPEIAPQILLNLNERFGWSSQSSNNWIDRQHNTWMTRLVEHAEMKLGKRFSAWGNTGGRRIETVSDEGTPVQKTSGFLGAVSAFLSILWLIARIIIVFMLIGAIGEMLK